MYVIAFLAVIASFGVATTLSKYGEFRDIDFSTNSILFFFIVPSFVYSSRAAKYLMRLLILTGERSID